MPFRLAACAGVVFLVLTLGLAMGTSPAFAQASPSPTANPPAGAVFGIQAGLYGKTPLPNDDFVYSLKSGASIADSAVLYNFTAAPIDLAIYGADVATASGGGLAPGQEGQKMTQVGAWLHLASSQVTVPSKGQASVKFTLTVPVGTVPGDYLGAVVASLATPAVKGGVNVETRVARLVRLTVAGKANLGVRLSRLTTTASHGGEVFSLTVDNTGNVLFTFSGAVTVTGGHSRTVALQPQGIYVIPGARVVLKGRWSQPPALGRRSAIATLRATVPGQAVRTFTSNTLHLTFIPWRLILPIAIPLLALVVLAVLTRKRWKAELQRRKTERAAIRELRQRLRTTEDEEVATLSGGNDHASPVVAGTESGEQTRASSPAILVHMPTPPTAYDSITRPDEHETSPQGP